MRFNVFVHVRGFQRADYLLRVGLPSMVRECFLVANDAFYLGRGGPVNDANTVGDDNDAVLRCEGALGVVQVRVEGARFTFEEVYSRAESAIGGRREYAVCSAGICVQFFYDA